MPIWMAFCEQAMATSWSWAMWAKWVSRVRVCSSTRGSDQLHLEAISTTFRAGEKGRLLVRLTCHPRGPRPEPRVAPTWNGSGTLRGAGERRGEDGVPRQGTQSAASGKAL